MKNSSSRNKPFYYFKPQAACKTCLIFVVIVFLNIPFSNCQETTSWKTFPGEYESQVRQNFATADAAFTEKNFEKVRSEYNRVLAVTGVPAQYKSYAQLRIAQSYLAEKNLSLARAEYEKIKADPSYPEVHRYEAGEYIKEIDRIAKGLPARDITESRTSVKPLSSFAAEFYIAPNGKDSNPGTLKKPFATLGKARDEVRSLKTKGLSGPVAVNLLPGKYQMQETFVLTSDDSGTPAAPVVYRAVKKQLQCYMEGQSYRDSK